jgi:hypothetical protein
VPMASAMKRSIRLHSCAVSNLSIVRHCDSGADASPPTGGTIRYQPDRASAATLQVFIVCYLVEAARKPEASPMPSLHSYARQ